MPDSPGSSNTPIELDGLTAIVHKVVYQPEAETPPDQPYCFVYFIEIQNNSDRSVTIKGRKWVVKNQENEIVAVEGSGVVGETPTIHPGENFTYNSYHLLDTPTGVAEGSYLGIDESGQAILVRIPAFTLEID